MSPLMLSLLVVAGLVAVLAVLVARQPRWLTCSRSAVVGGSPESVFALINALPAWRQWSPWEALDPDMERTFAGPDAGVGAQYGWKGNAKVGEGKMEVIESMPSERVKLQLTFFKPFACTMTATFELIPEGAGTRVTWTNDGPNSLPGRIMGVFCNMDKMMGGSFEQGLAQLDGVVRS